MFSSRTDLAKECIKDPGAKLPGVRCSKTELFGITAEETEIFSASGEKTLGKPRGRYTTLDISPIFSPEQNAFERCVRALCSALSRHLPPDGGGRALCVGLGNRKLTADSLGPAVADGIIPTRHLLKDPGLKGCALREVAVISPGVLGDTGLESAETVLSLVKALSPSVCVLIDSLASLDRNGLCKSVQISDTGIAPGSGVGNHRFEINEKVLGVPCVSVGVPTVVDAATLASSVAKEHGIVESGFSFPGEEMGFFVTPKDIDSLSRTCARVLSTGLNLALQPSLSLSDVELLRS